jgi:hypothetical protein
MKLKQNKDTTTLAVGDIDAKSFGVDTSNGVIFDILRNKMYSNKIAAVAREISSNSRDANRENNKAGVPVEISIIAPNELINSTDMQVMFQDRGVGITPDRMDNIFLKYGASSKRNTNKQTGGFGLGAKTPFAYTDTFTIITVCDVDGKRMKYTYTASITDRAGVGSGEMILFSEEKTKEETGTAIVVPIKESDRYEFENEIYRATCFWKTQPKFKGFDSEPWKLKTEYKGKGFYIVHDEKSHFDDPCYLLVIDGIPYTVDRGVLGWSSDLFYGTDKILCFEYSNGELTISANREAVQYDRQTKTKLLWRMRQAKNTFYNELNAKFAACKNYLEACIFGNAMEGHTEDKKMQTWQKIYSWIINTSSRNNALKNFKFTYGGKVLAKEANFLYYDVFRYADYDANGKLFGLEMSKRRFDDKWQFPMYMLTSGKRHTGRNAALVEAGGFILIVPVKIELKEGKDKAQETHYQEMYDKAIARQAEELKMIESFGVTLGDYNTVVPKVMPKGVSDSQYYKKTNEVGVQVRAIGNSSHYSNWSSNTITFLRKEKTTADGKQYVYCTTDKLSNFASYAANSPELPSTNLLDKGIIASQWLGLEFVCVPERDAHYFADANMMTIAEAWAKVENDQAMIDKIVEALNFRTCKNLRLDDAWHKVKLTGRIDARIEAIIEMTKEKRQKGNIFIDLEVACTNLKPTIDTAGVKSALVKLYKKYPMLQFFVENYRDYYGSSVKAARDINKVMDVVDAYNVLSEEEEEELKKKEAEAKDQTAGE